VGTTLEGIPGVTQSTRLFVASVRLFLRDHAELNRLVAGEETSDRMIAWSVLDALSKFNGTPPITSFTLDEMLNREQSHLLLRLTAETVIESVGLLQTRNHINYSTGGINVGVNDKTPLLLQWLQLFKSTTEQRVQQVKVAFNIESILGPEHVGMHSEYWATNQSYMSY